MSKTSWYRINAEGTGSAVVYLYGYIGEDFWAIDGGNTAKKFATELDALSPRDIDLRINSEGGDVFEGYAIYSAINRYPGRVVAYVDGLAASIASIFPLAANETVIGEAAFFAIHYPWTCTGGNAEDLRKTADLLDAIGEQMVGIYEKHSNKSADEIRSAMAAETWIDAEEAVEWGFANRVEESLKAAACVTSGAAKHFAHLPDAVSVADDAVTRHLASIIEAEEETPSETDPAPGAESGDVVSDTAAKTRVVCLESGIYRVPLEKEKQ